MKSLANKAVAAAYNKLGHLNDLLNGPDPRFVSYRENGKDKKIEHLDLNAEHCHSYIGKMKIDGTGTYSDEVITALIKYFFDHTKKGDKVVIELANKVSELLNGKESMEEYMTFEEQKQHMLNMAKSLNKRRTKDLEIVEIEANNKRLFDTLENEGISGLKSTDLPDFKGGFDSLDIARHLYRATQNDPAYLEEIRSLKSESFNGENKDSDYYGLVEMAIRINALLHGITLQGGVARQKKYDALLLKHINPYVKEFPGLADFQQFCRDFLKGEQFKGLYFDTQESEKLVEKIDKKKQLKSNTRNALLLVLGLSVGIGATYITGKYSEAKKQKAMTEATIKDIFEQRSIDSYCDMGSVSYETAKEKMEQIQYYKDNIMEVFLTRFGGYGRLTKEQFENLVIGSISSQEALNILANGNDMSHYNTIIDRFLLSSQNKGILLHSGVDIIPYQRYKKYEKVFKQTINMSDDFKEKKISVDDLAKKAGFTDNVPKQIGGYEKLDGRGHGIGIVTIDGKQYIVGGGTIYKGEVPEVKSKDRSLYTGEEIAFDYFLQTKPIIPVIIDEYLLRYKGLDNLNSFTYDNGNLVRQKNEMGRDLERDIIRYIVNHNYYTVEKNNIHKIIEIVDNFVKQRKNSLQPYDFLNQYRKTFFRSAYNQIQEKSIMEETSPYKTEYVGKYRAKDGKIYEMLIIEIQGKQYIYARDINNMRYKTFNWYDGKAVAMDFIETYHQQ